MVYNQPDGNLLRIEGNKVKQDMEISLGCTQQNGEIVEIEPPKTAEIKFILFNN